MKAKEEYNSPFVEGRAEMDPSLKRELCISIAMRDKL
jgi:hypothetical protein